MKFTFSKDGKKYETTIDDGLLLREPIPSQVMDAYAAAGRHPDKILNDQVARIESLLSAHLAGKGPLLWKGTPLAFTEVKDETPAEVG